MENVQLFEVFTGKTLAMLYEVFPVVKEIKVEDLTSGADAGGRSLHDQNQIAGHTLMWLQRAGYIEPARSDETLPPFRGTLTAKGFECMRAFPNALDPAADNKMSMKTLGAQLTDAVGLGLKAGTTEAVKSLVGKILAYGVALGIGALHAVVKS